MSKKIKKLFPLLIIIFFFTINISLASAEDYRCLPTCAIKPEEVETGKAIQGYSDEVWLRQAAQEKCKGGDGCLEEEVNRNCCLILEEKNDYLELYGDFNVDDIVDEAINISQMLLGIVGSIALLFFIIAGVKMIFAGGSKDKISSAKTMMVQTIIGLMIFLGAYLIVNFIQDTLIENQNSKYKIDTSHTDYQ